MTSGVVCGLDGVVVARPTIRLRGEAGSDGCGTKRVPT
jgi:hypothetical protein